MGAAEWTGYTNSSPTYPTPTYSTLPPPGSAPTTSYGYEIANMDHPSNFHIPTGELRQSGQTTIRHKLTIICFFSVSFSRGRDANLLSF